MSELFTKLKIVEFNELYLEKSRIWLNDEEIKYMTCTPNFTRKSQLEWYKRLDSRADYKIYGVALSNQPIGAVGLKHIDGKSAEIFGYCGEKQHWGKGFGRMMAQMIIEKAKEKNIRSLYALVAKHNMMSLNLLRIVSFEQISEEDGMIKMELMIN